MAHRERLRVSGYVAAMAAAALWGTAGVVAKPLLTSAVGPAQLVAVRLTAAALILAASGRTRPVERHWWPYLALFGILGISASQFAYYGAIAAANVATAVFLQYLAPVLVAAWLVAVERQRLGWSVLAAVGLAVLGTLTLVSRPGGGLAITPAGLAFGLASAVAFGFYTLYARVGLAGLDAWTMLGWAMAAGALVWDIVARPWLLLGHLGATDWLGLGFIAVFGTVLPFGLYLAALRRLDPARVAVVATLEPVVAAGLGWWWLGERLGPLQVAGMVVILAAVVLAQVPVRRRVVATAVSGD